MKLGLDKSKKYGVAVSGGVDSMVLLNLARLEGLDCVALTVDHGLREVSGAEVEGVKNIAASYGYKTIATKIDCKGYAAENKVSIELAGRVLRYQFFEKVRLEQGLDYILLAHHLDDQVETMLMRILRGTGLYGLRGIVDRDYYLHPLLKYTKNEILGYATANNITYYEDATNRQSVYKRNVIRNKILPIIDEEFCDYRASFSRLARAAQETEDYLATCLITYERKDDAVIFSKSVYSAHPAIFKRSVRKALYDLGVEKDFEEKNYLSLFSIKDGTSGTSTMLGQGLIARIEYDSLIIERAPKEVEFIAPYDPSATIDFGGFRYTFSKVDSMTRGVTFDGDKVPLGAVVRTKKIGDVFKRCNGKSKSLSDYLTDSKLPLNTRRTLLYLADGNVILAILGVEISDAIKIDADTKTIIKVTKQ